MRRVPARSIIVLAAAAVIGATGYAFASGGGGNDPYAPRIACSGGGLLTARGTAPTSAQMAYLVYRDGTSVRTVVAHRRYTFVLLAQSPAGTPSMLRFVDGSSRTRDSRLAGSAFTACLAHAAAVLPVTVAARGATGKPPTTEDEAVILVNQARTIAFRTSKQCGNTLIPTPRLTFSNAAPSRAILAVLGVLRLPQTSEELAYIEHYGRGTPPDDMAVLTIYRRYARVIHEPGGHTARLIVGVGEQSLPKSALYPCVNAATRILRRLLPGHSKAVQREALRIQLGYKLGPQTHGFHPWLDYQGGGGTGGPFDVRRFKTSGIMIEGGSAQPPTPGYNIPPGSPTRSNFEWDLNGLVPDGVATVTLKLTGQGHYTQIFGKPSNYYRLHPTTITARVTENAFFLTNMPADPASAARQTVIWRNATGHALRQIPLGG